MQLLVNHHDAGSPYYRNKALAAVAASALYSLAQTFLCRTYNRHQDLNEVNGMFRHAISALLNETPVEHYYDPEPCSCTTHYVQCPQCLDKQNTLSASGLVLDSLPFADLHVQNCECYDQESICQSCLMNEQYEREIEMIIYELSNNMMITREMIDFLMAYPSPNVYLIDDNTIMLTDQNLPQYSLPAYNNTAPGFGVFRNAMVGGPVQSIKSYLNATPTHVFYPHALMDAEL